MDYCPDCGDKLNTVVKEGKDRNYCKSCDKVHWLDSSPCAAVLLKHEGKFLFIRRNYDPWKDHWSIPAGYMEHGENPKRTAVRELKEETGIALEKNSLEIIDAVDLTHPNGKEVVVIVYRAEAENVDVSFNDEVSEAELLGETEIPEKVSPLVDKTDFSESS